MKNNRVLQIFGSCAMGAFSAWTLPSAWFLHVFLALIGVTFLFGIFCTTVADEPSKLHPVTKAISFLLISTSRPNAIIKERWELRLFLLSAAWVLGMGVGIILLASA
ncbi:hypothetical protein [Collimonas sp. OK242]|jgi:hypothetical protein|uniref:hypothetical protein n=1 Tax=Collimonas sp. OK242 TaxID=1798195 RepID=UPI00115FCFAB|nr:hypothetical protein [Collimonas sp. OK242]